MSRKNTQLEEDIYQFILSYQSENGAAPSVREIAEHFACTPSNVQRYLNRLMEDKRIARKGVRNFTTRVNEEPIQQIPVVGTIACGAPIYADENIESYIPVRSSFLGAGEFFALTAKGDSMIEAGINDGDIVFVRKTDTAEEGQIVVALIEDEATLKRYRLDPKNRKVILHPENKTMKDIILDSVIIEGVAVKVIKSI